MGFRCLAAWRSCSAFRAVPGLASCVVPALALGVCLGAHALTVGRAQTPGCHHGGAAGRAAAWPACQAAQVSSALNSAMGYSGKRAISLAVRECPVPPASCPLSHGSRCSARHWAPGLARFFGVGDVEARCVLRVRLHYGPLRRSGTRMPISTALVLRCSTLNSTPRLWLWVVQHRTGSPEPMQGWAQTVRLCGRCSPAR